MSKSRPAPILVTGGNGYIGSHMCRLLVERGHQVHVIDNHSASPSAQVHDFGQFHCLDIGDQAELLKLFTSIRPGHIFHFAARALVPEGEADPLLYYRENLQKTIVLLEACVKSGVRKFIFSSTCATFGLPQQATLDESHPQNPVNTYGKTKKLMEEVMRDLAAKKWLDVVVFRYFNAAGCSVDGVLGENHEPETHLIPNLCKTALSEGSIPFQVFGTDYPTRDGTCIRDYIHVEDLVQAHYLGMKFLESQQGFFDFNLGSESGTSVREMVNLFEKVSGTKLNVVEKPRRAGDPPQLIGNSSKAKATLGFTPRFSVEECILHTLNFQKKRKQRINP